MPANPIRRFLRNTLLALTGIAISTFAPATPATAQDYRSCHARWVFQPTDPTGIAVSSARFSGRAGVAVGPPMSNIFGGEYNDARARAREKIEDCVRAHWAARDASGAPPVCLGNDGPGLSGIHGYPVANLTADIADLVCAANPGRDRLVIDVFVSVDGDTGCIPPPNRWAIDIRDGWLVECAEAKAATPTPRAQPAPTAPQRIAPTPQLQRAGPALPRIRLPGNDIDRRWIGTQGWQACAGLCVENPGCRAWTWRAPGTSGAGSQAACLLKSRAGVQVPDACCHSGLRE